MYIKAIDFLENSDYSLRDMGRFLNCLHPLLQHLTFQSEKAYEKLNAKFLSVTFNDIYIYIYIYIEREREREIFY